MRFTRLGRLIVSLFILCYEDPLAAATIRGVITRADNGKPIAGCKVFNTGTKIGTYSMQDGAYEISNVPAGTSVLLFSAIAYVSRIDTLKVSSADSVIVHNVSLQIPTVVSTPSLEDYHKRIAAFNSKGSAITIHINSLDIKDGLIIPYLSVTNNTDLAIYVLKVFECINPMFGMITDNTGEAVKPNIPRTDCTGEKILPTLDDCLVIRSHQTIEYPAFTLEGFDFIHLPRGWYKVRIGYRFEKPVQLCCYAFPPDYQERYAEQILTLTTVLRGAYVSTNSVTFENKP